MSAIGRKGFLIGAAGAAVLGTATIAVAIGSQRNRNIKTAIYEPAANSLTDQVILITGGSTGLGLESARRLAAAGATIVLTSRTLNKGEQAVQSVKTYLSEKGVENSKIYSTVLDLDDLESVRAYPASFKQLGFQKIDVLLNNAGVMAIPTREITKDGYERTFQSNHLGHFVLTAELFPLLSRDKATVINVASEAYQIASKGLALDNLNGEVGYGPWSSYGLSKLANILFTQELQRRADKAGDTWLTAVTLHPGVVATDLGRNLVGEEKWNSLKTKGPSFFESIAINAISLFTKTVPEGASTQVFLASGAEGALKKGVYYKDCKEKVLSGFAADETAARALWAKSEELGGIKFDVAVSTSTTS
jgi:NAD(P)-dependent dehydrogenase (short-subunit alcohol dehydrogenase family)